MLLFTLMLLMAEPARVLDPAWVRADYEDAGAVWSDQGVVHLEEGEGLTGVNWAGDCPGGDYEITLDAMRVRGDDFFCGLTFPVGKRFCTLIAGGWGGRLVGLSNLDEMDAYHNETRTYMDFEPGRWYAIRLRVAGERIQAWIDGKRLIDISIKDRHVGIRADVTPSKPLGIASWFTAAAFRGFRIEALKAK